jgi:hypothetical protein
MLMSFWNRLVFYDLPAIYVVNRIPADDPDTSLLLLLLKPLGIEQGKPFKPDAREKQILTDASQFGWALSETISYASRSPEGIVNPANTGNGCCSSTPVCEINSGAISNYGPPTTFRQNLPHRRWKRRTSGLVPSISSRSATERELARGGQNYPLHVPANPAAKEFWSVTMYDWQTRSMVQPNSNIAARSSADKLKP